MLQNLRKCVGVAAALLTLGSVATISSATVLLSENFNYANGVLDSVGSAKWSRISGSANDLLVSGGQALVKDASQDDDAATLLSSVNSGSIFASFTLTGDAADRTTSPGGSEYLTGFYTSGGSFLGRVAPAIPAGSPAGTFRLGISNSSAASADVILGTNLTLGTAYTIVIRFDFTTAQTTLWVNPTSIADPGITSTTAATLPVTINRYGLRQPSTDTMGDYALDNLLVATTFAEVVPEPASISMIVLAGGMLLARRRA